MSCSHCFTVLAVGLLVQANNWQAAVAGPAEILGLPTGSNYIYVYDMPDRFTHEILAMPLDQEVESWSQWYDMDQHVHRCVGPPKLHRLSRSDLRTEPQLCRNRECRFLQSSPAATPQPEAARLYFIPLYLGRL